MTAYTYHGANIIDGEHSKDGTATYRVANAQTGAELPGRFHDASTNEIDRAVSGAGEATDANTSKDPSAWADLLERMADELEAIGDLLVARVVEETALGEARVRGERGRTTGQLRMFARVVREGSWVDARIDPGMPDRKPSPRPDLRRMLIPIGPVAVFGASNFPLAFSVAGGDTASALAAGCPVIVKAHPAHPGTSELVGDALSAAVQASGFHPATFSMIHGKAPEVSLQLVRHPLLQAVGFTGSLRAGRALFDAAAARPSPIPVYAEMGSVNPVFVLPGAMDARREAIAEGLVGSVTLGAGQFCTNPGLVFGLAGDGLEGFVDDVAKRLSDTPAYTMLHGGIADAYRNGIHQVSDIEGVTTVARAEPGNGAGAAVFVTDAAVYARETRLHEEVFGPSTLVVRCESMTEIEQIAATMEGNLTASLHGTEDDLAAAEPLVRLVRRRVGRLIFNGYPTGVEVCPSMHHGGPYPATTDVRSTSVGTAAIQRFARPICYQDFPQEALPHELRDTNNRGIWRMVEGEMTRSDIR